MSSVLLLLPGTILDESDVPSTLCSYPEGVKGSSLQKINQDGNISHFFFA